MHGGTSNLNVPRRNSRFWLKLTLAVLATAAPLLLTDWCLQAMLPIPAPGSGEWAGPPRSELKLVSTPDQFESVHRYNELGFRGSSIPPHPTPGRQRIICIGDSWTEGIGADESGTWPAVMARQLPTEQFEVINLGDAGANPDRYLDILSKVGIALQPQQCLMCVIPSDFYDGPKLPQDSSVRERLQDDFRQRDSALATLLARTLPGWTFLVDRSRGKWHQRQGIYWNSYSLAEDFLAQHIADTEQLELSAARQKMQQRMSTLEPACVQAAKRAAYNGYRIDLELFNPHASFRCRVEDMHLPVEQLRAATRQWLTSVAERCQEYDIAPTLCFFPEAGLVSRAPVGPMIDEYYTSAPDITNDNSLSELLAQQCQQLGVAYLDCTPVLRAHRTETLFLRYDGHPNARAYEIVGRWLAEQLLQPARDRQHPYEPAVGQPVGNMAAQDNRALR